jgi:O-antigen/teichoic acid export membrane protein
LIRKKEATSADLSTAFYSNIVLGCLAYALLFFLAPLVSTFYQEPRLTELIRVLGLVIVINAFQVVQRAILNRDLNFKGQFKATIPATIGSGCIAVAMAYLEFGVWALVTQMLAASLLSTITLWWLRLWRPSRIFDTDALKAMYGFGYKLFISGFVDTAFKNIYVVVIAKLFATTLAGYYFLADKIKEQIINQLVGSVETVTYPALSTIQHDDARLEAGYRKVIKVTTFLLFPAMFFLAVLAEPVFRVLLPDEWRTAIPYFQLMCLAGVLIPVHSVNLNILKVKGRSDLFLLLELIKKGMVIVVLTIAVRFGIVGILIGQIFTSVVAYVPNSYFSGKLIRYSVSRQIMDFFPSLLLSASIAGLTYLGVQHFVWRPVVELFVWSIFCIATYLIGAYLFRFEALILTRDMLKAYQIGRAEGVK